MNPLQTDADLTDFQKALKACLEYRTRIDELERKLADANEYADETHARHQSLVEQIAQLQNDNAADNAALRELATEHEKVRVLRYVVSQILEAMPKKRDWLDPVLEKVALAATKEASK